MESVTSTTTRDIFHQIARARAELDALAGESREDERDAVALPPPST